ncbi:type VII secretion protein EccB [Streptomyces sp. TRM68367]|uniref:type VII secretion protein EccB n=1 Tax=Streptomyces sp. TRM68367 TaxID=2758415 RepID=UPI00165A9F41|nr:type VII secretion protein EccB [Streptomyces sp. TRM68367]MBC9730531.1 type VII secretion protein EccB [Streptomyces sp. TRM68367]
MQNRRDHVQAHRFAVGRLVSALLAGDAAPVEIPMRRGTLGVQFGALVAILLAIGCAVFGLIVPANTAWRKPGSIVVESETGNRFIYLGKQLYPIANYASGLLIGGNDAQVVTVPRATLDGVSRGPEIGISGAPDDVPPATALLTGERAVCLPPGSETELVDLDPAGRTRPVPHDRWILLAGPDHTKYVLWNGEKFPLRSHTELVALNLVAQEPIDVSAAWLAELPTGATLAAPHIRGAGSAGPSVAGHPAKVGQLFVAEAAGARELFVLRPDGLAPLSRTAFALLSAVPGAAPAERVSATAAAAAPASRDRSLLTVVPDLLSGSAFSPDRSALCVRRGAGSTAHGTVVTEPVAAGSRTSGLLVPAGRGMLVMAQSQRSSASPQLYLITDTGRKYPLADSNTVMALGYSQTTVRTLPDKLLALAPTGPTLDPAAARTVVRTSAG